MTLLLLRHGKSDWSGGEPDFDRPVSDRGKRDAQRVGHYLQREELVPELIVASPARRAADTAEKCIKAAGAGTEIIIYESRLYEASLDDLLAVLAEYQGRAGRIMFVGHNPGFDELLEHLVVERLAYSKGGKLMTTAALAVVEGDSLERLVRPKELPQKFLVETRAGAVQRDRPPYYYTQSGVLPFRIRRGQVEVLLISKRGKQKWGIPKGIVEPGMTAHASAAKECEEEAGALGRLDTSSLGNFDVNKWGGTCEVSVYPLAVTELLDDWDERHKRDRRWFYAEDAQDVIHQREVVPMIDGLLARYMKVLE